jgi:hypothetical protein
MRARIWIAMFVLLLAAAFASLHASAPAVASASPFLRTTTLPLEEGALQAGR